MLGGAVLCPSFEFNIKIFKIVIFQNETKTSAHSLLGHPVFVFEYHLLFDLYVQHVTDWSVTPAKSRELNRPCVLLNFYDTHDCWHFLSALSLFLSFAILLRLDDDLERSPRNAIAVF